MHNIFPYFLTNFHQGLSPVKNMAAAVCSVNGQVVPCGDWSALLSSIFLGFMFAIIVASLVIAVLTIIGMWKVFEKAGQKGWAALIPIYNIIITLRVIKEPWWWIFFYFIPVANFVISFIIAYEMSRVFGKGLGFTVGLVFLPFIFYPILGLGQAAYNPSVKTGAPAPQT